MRLFEMWKQGQVYLALVPTPLPYNGIVVEFFFSIRFLISALIFCYWGVKQTLFPNTLPNHSLIDEQHDKAESRVFLVQGMDKFFLKSFTLFQSRNMRV